MNSVEYNFSMADKWFQEKGIDPRIPPVDKQVKTIDYDSGLMFPHGYNPSIVQFDDRTFMVYRYHPSTSLSTSLAIAELDSEFRVIVNKPVNLNESGSREDAKLFVHNGQLWMSWVSSTWPVNPSTCVVKYGRLIEGSAWNAPGWVVEDIEQPIYGKNDWSALEKNWVPFSHGGEIHFIYEHGSVIHKVGDVWTPIKASIPSGWRYGPIKGGSSPMPYKGKWLRFAHSTLDNEPRPWYRRYYILAMIMEPEPPFTVIQLSKEPIIRGSEIGNVKQDECGHFKAKVIFVSGAIAYQDAWVLSVGVNDCESVLAKITEGDLRL